MNKYSIHIGELQENTKKSTINIEVVLSSEVPLKAKCLYCYNTTTGEDAIRHLRGIEVSFKSDVMIHCQPLDTVPK
jgi:hypothetical protein